MYDFYVFQQNSATHDMAVHCVTVVWVACAGNRSTEVEVLDAVGSSNPGSSHTNGHTHAEVNLLREEL
jgi:hypothetical protein